MPDIFGDVCLSLMPHFHGMGRLNSLKIVLFWLLPCRDSERADPILKEHCRPLIGQKEQFLVPQGHPAQFHQQ